MSLKIAQAQWYGHRSPCFLLQFESNLQGRTSVSPCQGVFEATSADIQYLQLAVATVFDSSALKNKEKNLQNLIFAQLELEVTDVPEIFQHMLSSA